MRTPNDMTVAVGSLVRWTAGAGSGIGVVVDVDSGGRRIRVRFDTGEENLFAWPSDVLERVVFDTGTQVHIAADDEVGVVGSVTDVDGKIFYGVQLPGGIQKTVLEDGVRVAVVTDPLQLLRAGTLDEARSVNLRIAATRLLFAHQFDELSSLSNSRVEIKPHQVGVLHRVATSYPHRFLLADEVGLGKTIEAGLILKELKARSNANRVLILAPSGIVSQWQFELKTKFNEIFAHLNSQSVAYLKSNNPGENVWALHENVIASTGYACWNDQRAREIALVDWDMVIVDEAHHARRTLANLAGTKLLRLVEALADPEHVNSRSMLFLSATPMQLHPFELYSLIELLDPTLFPSFEEFEAHRQELAGLNLAADAARRWAGLSAVARTEAADQIGGFLNRPRKEIAATLDTVEGREEITEELLRKHRLSEALVRNRKAVVGGFMPRVAAVWEVELSEPEWLAYHAVTEYARSGFERARLEKNNALGFLMVAFQKLNCSSSAALKKSLLRRVDKLQSRIDASKSVDIEDSDLDERPTSEALDEVLAARFYEETGAEIDHLRSLVELLDAIPLDSKTDELLARLEDIARSEPDAKVLIFTQFRDTQTYLADHISAPWTVHLFHGQLSPSEKDQAVTRFRDLEGPQILISTEAGGEGRNFQFCHMLVNYDLPWNPMKVEQRIGRIDRIGQQRPVTIFNLSTLGTIEERVLKVLSKRIGLFEETVGGLDPILGDVERDLRRILTLADERAADEMARFEAQLESRVAQARAAERRLADLIMDSKSFRQDEVRALLERKGSLSNTELRAFVLGALNELGATAEPHLSIENVYELRLRGRFADEFPVLTRDAQTRMATFDPSTALAHEEVEFLAFGHELVDSLVDFVRKREYPGRASHRRLRTNDVPPQSGWFFVYALEFEGVSPSKEVYPVYIGADGVLDEEFGEWLLERAARIKREDWSTPASLPARDASFEAAVETSRSHSLQRMLARQAQLADANRERLDQERRKLERYYEYKERAATAKLASVRTVYDRLLVSDDGDDQRILPVWAKNLENAERLLENLASERERRLADLDGREQVGVQHELLSASFVEVVPDYRDAVRETGLVLPSELRDRIISLYEETSPEELQRLREALGERRTQLEDLGKKHTIDARGTKIAATLMEAIEASAGARAEHRDLLAAAARYFLLVDDGVHDLASPTGFEDDGRIVDAVLHVIASG